MRAQDTGAGVEPVNAYMQPPAADNMRWYKESNLVHPQAAGAFLSTDSVRITVGTALIGAPYSIKLYHQKCNFQSYLPAIHVSAPMFHGVG